MNFCSPDYLLHLHNVSYFSFFSDFKYSGKVFVKVVETAVLLVLLGASLVGNITAIVLVSRQKQPWNKNFFVLNLFVADLLFVSMIPFIIVVRWTESWTLGASACRLLLYVMCISGCVTIATLATISLERMCAIRKLQVKPAFNLKLVSCAVGCVWMFSILTSLPLCLFFQVMPVTSHGKTVQICTLMWPSVVGEITWEIAFAVLDFFIPGLIIVISYGKLLQITKSSQRRLKNGRWSSRADGQQFPVSRQDLKLLRTLLLLVGSFCLMWSPIFITSFLILIRNFRGDLFIPSSMFFWMVTFTFANSALNPILYGVSQFRSSRGHGLCCFTRVAPVMKAHANPHRVAQILTVNPNG